MKKLVSLIVLPVLIVSLFVSLNTNQASAAFTCGTDTRCKSATMIYGKQQYVASGSLYFNYGETMVYEWDNDQPGIMQVSFAIFNSSGTKISKALVATGQTGSNYGFHKAPKSGYYYLFASCEGGNDTRCQGGGTIRKN